MYSKKDTQTYFVSAQISNPQILGLILQSQSANFWGVPVRKSQIRKFVMINPQIAYPQISLVFQPANRKPANLKKKETIFLVQIRIG